MPKLVVSLDFELLWGVIDSVHYDEYKRQVLHVPSIVDRLLLLFDKYKISATWAVVGLMMCESKDEMLERLPHESAFRDSKLDVRKYIIHNVGEARNDKLHFAMDLVNKIRSVPGQEIGSHTFSHFNCLESSFEELEHYFESDLKAMSDISLDRDIALDSFVFCRNQYNQKFVNILSNSGYKIYRGSPYTDKGSYKILDKISRKLDSYLHFPHSEVSNLNLQHLSGNDCIFVHNESMFFIVHKDKALQKIHEYAIHRSMYHAFDCGGDFHLWFHPWNLGKNIDLGLNSLEYIFSKFIDYKNSKDVTSCSMGGLYMNIINNLLSIFIDIFILLLFPILYLLPRDKWLILFTEWDGEPRGDNPWALYVNLEGYKKYWITNNKSLNGVNNYVYKYSLHSFWLHLVAGNFVFSHNIRTQFLWPLTIGSKKILIWHGVPLKKIGLQRSRGYLNSLWIIYNKYFRLKLSKIDLVFCQSDYERDVISESFNIVKDTIVVTGYPKFTYLETFNSNSCCKELCRRKKILYAPTLRQDSSVFDSLIENYCKANLKFKDVCDFYLRIHPAQFHTIVNGDVVFYNNKKIDYSYFDCIVTDYSGVLVEASLLNCPVYVLAPDIDSYRATVGFNELFTVVTKNVCFNLDDIVEDLLGDGVLMVNIPSRDYYIGVIPEVDIYCKIADYLKV